MSDKYCMISLICESKKYKKVVNIKEADFTDTENKIVVTTGSRKRVGAR